MNWRMNDPMKEVEEIETMSKWFGKNLDKLPLMHQLSYMSEVMKFANAIKPIYLAGVMMLEDGSVEGSGGDEGGEI